MRRKRTAFRGPLAGRHRIGFDGIRCWGADRIVIRGCLFGLVTTFLRTVGDELRRARQKAGLALRDLNDRSDREFKASAVGGYERGERSISLYRFCRLAALYGVPPDQILARVMERASPEAEGDVVIDLRRAEEPAAEEMVAPDSARPSQ
jgi:transcriptional regulator with XRE-family HTH domain